MRATVLRWGSIVALAISASCGNDVNREPAGKTGGAGGAGGAGAGAASGASTSANGSSSSDGVGGVNFATSQASSSTGGEVHTMCFTWDASMPCPSPDQAPGYLCTPCPGKGCYLAGEVVGGPVYENGSCCYEVVGECNYAP